MMMLHWMVNTDSRKLNPSEDYAYFYMNVIRKPKPTNIITCTSCYIGYYWDTSAQSALIRPSPTEARASP